MEPYIIRNVLHNKNRNWRAVQVHVEPPPIPLIESKIGEKLYKDCVEIKLHRDIMSETSDIYELNMSLFDDGKPEELLLFVRNF